MITLLTGDFGSGKTTAIADLIAADLAAGRPAILLVPEQETVTAERRMAELLPPSAPLTFEVSNFSRLANTVFRRVGGLSYHYADPATRTLIMWRTMGELLPLLHEGRGNAPDLGRVRKMTAAMQELSALSLTPTQLENAARSLPEGSHLRDKLTDLSLIATLYHALLREKYDDVTDDLVRLGDLLADGTPLAGTRIYVDGFISFTEQEYRVLSGLARASDLTLTLALPAGREEELCFLETRATATRLERMAAGQGGELIRRDMGDCRRAESPYLRGLLRGLLSDANAASVCREIPRDSSVSVVRAKDAFGMAEYVAADIARRVAEEGARYRDFAIITRRTEDYAGILDVTLDTAEIPCFLSKKTDISAYPAVKLIFTAYAVCTGGWRQSDVVAYLKCGLSGIPLADADAFSMYTDRWHLTGRRMTDGIPWNMNPEGYTARMTDRGAEILARVEEVRERLVEQLAPLAEACRRRPVREHCVALFDFLSSLDLENRLADLAEEARVSGNREEAEELSRLFAVLCDALDRLCDTLSDTVVAAEEFVDLLRLMLGEVQLARIPSSVDEVTVGSADLVRVGDVRHVYLLGLNDGEFPATVSTRGVFSEGDRRILSELGLPVLPDLLLRSARELFCFARAFSLGSASVTLLYAERSLSSAAFNPTPLLSNLIRREGLSVLDAAALTPADRFFRRGSALDHLGLLSGTPFGEALARYFAPRPDTAPILEATATPLVDPVCRLTPETAAAITEGGISLSQSRMEHYVECPFAYFCKDVLRLNPGKSIDFDYADVGNLLHTVLERFFTGLRDDGLVIASLTGEEVRARVSRVLSDYTDEICPGTQRSSRLTHLLGRLARTADLVAMDLYEEFSQSRFTPSFFEADLADNSPDAPGSPRFTLPDGTPITLYGRIDRVDTWQDGDKTYVRVVDYKSGDKSFSLDDVARGLNIQLLVYLFSLWKSESAGFRRALAGDGEILPAGVLYSSAKLKEGIYDAPGDPAEVERRAAQFARSGLLLEDEGVLRAMDRELDGRFIPVRMKKDGGYYRTSEKSLASLEKMGTLMNEIGDTVCRIGAAIRAGEAGATPLQSGRKSACEHCEMKAVCRASQSE